LALATSNNTSKRISFASSIANFEYPDFLDIQLKSFQEFFQLETTPENRAEIEADTGISTSCGYS